MIFYLLVATIIVANVALLLIVMMTTMHKYCIFLAQECEISLLIYGNDSAAAKLVDYI